MARVEVRLPMFPECWETCGNCAQDDVFVAAVHVRAGAALNFDDFVITLETGKVALDISAPNVGMVSEVLVRVGDQLKAGQLLCVLETE
ncbi:MAG: biotin/lipoyl-containing protein [Sterolibacterium sp.]